MTILFVIASLFSSPVQASFYDHHAEGWHWYQDSNQLSVVSNQNPLRGGKVKPGSFKEKDKPEAKTPEPSNDPIAQLESFKKSVERLKAIAVLNPTMQNVKAYMVIQKELMDRSTRFAQKWMCKTACKNDPLEG